MNSFEKIIDSKFAVVAFAAALFAISCNREKAPDCFQSAGEYNTEKRLLEEFSSIELHDYIQYELCDTNFFGVEVTAPGNLISDIKTEVTDSKLRVRNTNSCNFVRSYKNRITVRLYAPQFSDIQNFSTGDITSVNVIVDALFSIENRGAAGTQHLTLHCDTVNLASHTGVSDAFLNGQCDVVKLFNQGLGITDARALSANYAFVNNSSLNDVYVQSHSYLFGYIQFSGNIFYEGNPQTIDEQIEGDGDIIAF
jgi:hypothetical protein